MSEKKAGNCQCKTKNPKGRGCLADVRQVVDQVMQKHGMKKPIDLQSLGFFVVGESGVGKKTLSVQHNKPRREECKRRPNGD